MCAVVVVPKFDPAGRAVSVLLREAIPVQRAIGNVDELVCRLRDSRREIRPEHVGVCVAGDRVFACDSVRRDLRMRLDIAPRVVGCAFDKAVCMHHFRDKTREHWITAGECRCFSQRISYLPGTSEAIKPETRRVAGGRRARTIVERGEITDQGWRRPSATAFPGRERVNDVRRFHHDARCALQQPRSFRQMRNSSCS